MRIALILFLSVSMLVFNGCVSFRSAKNSEREIAGAKKVGKKYKRNKANNRKKANNNLPKSNATAKAEVVKIQVPGKRVKMIKMGDGTIIESGKTIKEIFHNTFAPNEIKSCGTFTYEGRKNVFFAMGGWNYLLEGENGLKCYWIPARLETKSGETIDMLFPYPLELQIPSENDIRRKNFMGYSYFGWSGNRILLKEDYGNIDKYPLVAVAFSKGLPAAKIIEKYKKDFPDVSVTSHPHYDRGGGVEGTIENNDFRIIFASRYGDERTFIVIVDKKIEEYFGRGWQKEKERQETIEKDEKEKRKKKMMDF